MFTQCILLFATAIYLHAILWNCSPGCDLLCIHIGMTHHNCTEWVWNPFLCDFAHRNASHTEQITKCEHFHKPTYNPFNFIKSHVNKSQLQKKCTVCVSLYIRKIWSILLSCILVQIVLDLITFCAQHHSDSVFRNNSIWFVSPNHSENFFLLVALKI